MGDPSPRLRETGGAAANAARVPCDALRCRPMRRLRRAGRPTGAASTVSARRACQRCDSSARPGSERPRPRLQRHAPRLGGIINTRGVPRSPRGPREVPRGSRLAVWVERARLRFGVARRAWGGASARETSRWIAIRHLIAPFGAHVGVSRPRCRWQLCGGGTLPRRHESLTRKIVSKPLAATGPKAALGACHYPVRTNPHPQRLPGK